MITPTGVVSNKHHATATLPTGVVSNKHHATATLNVMSWVPFDTCYTDLEAVTAT